jgi:hypothetical protein
VQPPGTWTVSEGWGEDLRKPPTDASPGAKIEFTLSKKIARSALRPRKNMRARGLDEIARLFAILVEINLRLFDLIV